MLQNSVRVTSCSFAFKRVFGWDLRGGGLSLGSLGKVESQVCTAGSPVGRGGSPGCGGEPGEQEEAPQGSVLRQGRPGKTMG